MQNLMRNSMVHLVKISAWAKKVMSKNVDVGILLKIIFFADRVLSFGVLKW